MATQNEEVKALADGAMQNKTKLKALIDQLSAPSRRDRQIAASAVKEVAHRDNTKLIPYINEIVDALNRPEAQTRWEALESLAHLIEHDSRTCSKALPDAETALFDEESGPVRLAAMRFLCKLGGTTQARSEKVWPLINEGIQCYHGDTEYNDMLIAIIDFSGGKLSDEVKSALAERMAFDAENGKGLLSRRARQIVDNLR